MKTFYYAVWRLVRTLGQVLFGLQAVNEERMLMTGPVIVASNHQSYFDPPFVSVMIKREMHFFAKQELFDIPLFGRVITALNAIPVRRGVYDPKSLKGLYDALEAGGGIIMFPEGTRSKGRGFLKPKPGIGMIAHKAKVPVVPVFALRTNRAAEALFKRRRMQIFFGDPIAVADIEAFADDKDGYRALAEYVMGRIAALKEEALGTGADDDDKLRV